jgi:hypothetical protein
MKMSFLKPVFALLLAPAILLAFTTKPDKANFSGEWKLNAGKSDLGQFGDFATHTIKTTQTDNNIAIARTAPSFGGDGDNTSTETLTFDGKEAESTVFGNSKRKATAKWLEDGKKLSIAFAILLDFNGETNEIKGTETWTLSGDGKTLTVETSTTSSFGDMTTKAVYEKK